MLILRVRSCELLATNSERKEKRKEDMKVKHIVHNTQAQYLRRGVDKSLQCSERGERAKVG